MHRIRQERHSNFDGQEGVPYPNNERCSLNDQVCWSPSFLCSLESASIQPDLNAVSMLWLCQNPSPRWDLLLCKQSPFLRGRIPAFVCFSLWLFSLIAHSRGLSVESHSRFARNETLDSSFNGHVLNWWQTLPVPPGLTTFSLAASERAWLKVMANGHGFCHTSNGENFK